MHPQATNTKDCQSKLGKTGRIHLWASEGPWPCQQFDFRFLAFRTKNKFVWHHTICGTLSQKHKGTDTLGNEWNMCPLLWCHRHSLCLKGLMWQLCDPRLTHVWALPPSPADTANGKSLWAPPGYGKDGFSPWLSGALPPSARTPILPALARTSDWRRELCHSATATCSFRHCSSVCCHLATPKGPVKVQIWGADPWDHWHTGHVHKLHQCEKKHVPPLLKD